MLTTETHLNSLDLLGDVLIVFICEDEDIIKALVGLLFLALLAHFAGKLTRGAFRGLLKGFFLVRVLTFDLAGDLVQMADITFYIVLFRWMLQLGDGLPDLSHGDQLLPVLVDLLVVRVLTFAEYVNALGHWL